jgi:PAS domain S-box-containing protein
MVEAMTEGALIATRDGTITYANRSLAAMLNRPLEEVIGSVMDRFVLAEDLRSYRELVDERGASTTKGEIRLTAKGGSVVSVLLSISFFESGSPHGACVVVTDLAEHKRHEESMSAEALERHRRAEAEELRRSEERFRRYFDLGLIGMAITSPAKNCLEVNDELCRILGYEREVLLRGNWLDFTHPDDLAADLSHFERVMAGEIDGYSMDKRWIHKDGHVIHTIMAARCVRRDDGSVDFFVGLVQDVTARRQAEEALRKAQVELAHANRLATLGELAVSVAHEINQPLAAIVTNADACRRWLHRAVPDLDEARQAVERVAENAFRASDVINRMRVLGTKSAAKHEPLDVNDVIRETIAFMAGELADNRVAWQLDLQNEVSSVSGDRVQLQQVLLNVIVNSVEAMSESDPSVRTLLIRTQENEPGELTIAVQDNGIGLPQDAERIFESFVSTKPNGLGLGLSISRNIAEAHGGRLWATRNSGAGATFYLSLPHTSA